MTNIWLLIGIFFKKSLEEYEAQEENLGIENVGDFIEESDLEEIKRILTNAGKTKAIE